MAIPRVGIAAIFVLVGCAEGQSFLAPDQSVATPRAADGGPTPKNIIPPNPGVFDDQGADALPGPPVTTSSPCEKRCTDQASYLCVTDPASGMCVECLSDSDCQANPGALGSVCDIYSGYCECYDDDDCAGKQSGSKCKKSELVCGCWDDGHCAGGHACIGEFGYTKVCKAPCASDADCAGNMFDRVCDPQHGCVECVSSANCGSETTGDSCFDGYCFCESDEECAGNLNGTRCLHDVCACKGDDDCPPGRTCAGEYLGSKICI